MKFPKQKIETRQRTTVTTLSMSIASCLLIASSLLFFNSCTEENKSTLSTVTTASPAASITQTGASIGGNITANGGAAVTESGVVFGTSANPVIAGSKVATSPNVATGAFTVNLIGLTANTNYFARAYAKNSVGVSYGADITFTTPVALTAPVVAATSAATSITQTGANIGGNITANGGDPVTESGVVFGTATSPVITGSKVATSPNVATGAFTVSLTGLTANTNYFARAFAKNSVGVSYGTEITFKTTAAAPLEFFTNRAAWGFEQASFPDNAEITTFSFPSGQATAAIDATSGANGTSKSLQVTFAQAVEFQLNTWTFFGPAGGKTYTLSYWVKGSATTNNSGLQTWLRRPDNTGQVLFDGGSSLNITTSWQKVSFDFTAPAGSTNLVGWNLQLKIGTSPASGSISFDEFSIIEKN